MSTTAVDLAPNPIKVGDLAYMDTLSALVPCKVLEVQLDAGTWYLGVQLTASRGAYNKGETLYKRADRVPPRGSVRTRNGQYRITNNWHVVDAEGQRHDIFG